MAENEQPGRFKQIRMVAGMVAKADRKALPIVFGSALGTLAIFVLIGIFVGPLWFMIPLGLMLAIIVGLVIFGQFAQRTQYRMLEGQIGAAYGVLDTMRGNWVVTPAVAGNRNMDVVHRVVGRPGVILVSEGPSSRVGSLLGAEKKKVSRLAAGVTIYDIQVGTEDGQVPLAKLQNKLAKLPRNLTKAQVNDLNDRMRALPQRPAAPGGPMPKGVRLPKGPKPPRR
ncbi:DUF4191 domain-containing protein [Actinocorallia sp. A-T 12471]|uniref:DUF4191 domain-containing protein n=1 Tax=Actinocorallia sp. A-T 12471 TaxID=3089813 RepID=UPI0029CECE5D|nr:DUF4191 domain-containing protein [Actinocorallia sp. A-T 12471]MDX6743232.1 DUF4191 domain-containing protein [Actinocorallia sp. A-T 12471]